MRDLCSKTFEQKTLPLPPQAPPCPGVGGGEGCASKLFEINPCVQTILRRPGASLKTTCEISENTHKLKHLGREARPTARLEALVPIQEEKALHLNQHK